MSIAFSKSGKAMTCHNCGIEITHFTHQLNCKTVEMNQQTVQYYNKQFKNMMTFGLGGCYAALIVFKKEGKVSHVYMSHFSYLEYFISFIDLHLEKYSNYEPFVYLRVPGEYNFNTKNYEPNKEFMTAIETLNCNPVIEGYSLCPSWDDIYSTNLYCRKIYNKLYYFDVYGTIIKIT